MPGVTVLPNSPGLGSFGLPQLGKRMSFSLENGQQIRAAPATQNGGGRQYDDLTATAIKDKAIESVQRETRGISPMSLIKTARTQYLYGREEEARGDVKGSYAAYVKAASLAKMAIESPENLKGGVLYKEIAEFWKKINPDVGERLKAVENKLREFEKALAPGEAKDGPVSIADRMKALEGNGLNLGPSKRFSRALSDMTPPSSPKPISATPPTTLAILTPSTPALSAPSPHTLVSPSSFGPPSPSSTPSSSPQLNAYNVAEFTQAFPSIEELDESPTLSLPSVPTSLPTIGTGKLKLKDARTGEPSPSSPGSVKSATQSLDRPSSTPVPSAINSISSRPESPSKPTLPHRASGLSVHSLTPQASTKPIIPVSATTTSTELSSYLQLHKVLLLDVRNRADFEREHIRSGAAIACIEPSVLRQPNLTLNRLEESMVIARSDQSLFLNRDKFDLVVIYDDDSKSLGPSDSPLSVLHRLIGEQSIQRLLKRQPMLLVGGLSAWRHEFGDSWKPDLSSTSSESQLPSVSSHTSGANSRNPYFTNGTFTPPSPMPASLPGTPFHRSIMSLDQSSGHSRYPAEAAYPAHLPSSGGLTRKPALMRPSSSSISYTRSTDSIGSSSMASPFSSTLLTYPTIAPRISTSNSGSGTSSTSAFPIQYGIASPPQASVNPSQRRRTDYIDQSQEAISSLHSHTPITYPQLTTPRVLRPPPPAVTSALERQDNRPRLQNGMVSFKPPESKIGYDYPLTYWFDSESSVTVPFVKFFMDSRWVKCINLVNPLGSKGRLVQSFSKLLLQMWANKASAIYPHELRQTICSIKSQYQGADQHDSQEFLSFLLDGIHEDLNRIINKPPWTSTPEHEAELERLPVQIASDQEWRNWRDRNDSVIVDFFQGQFQNRLQCLTCETTSTTYNVFSILQVPIPQGESSRVALKRCLDAFFAVEILEKDDAWDCPKCKVKRKASKTLSLARLPPILLIHLKRFTNGDADSAKKITTFVDFPVKALDLTSYMPAPLPQGMDRGAEGLPTSLEDPRTQVPPYRYDLYGVTNHLGSLSGGHYTASIASRGGWVHCDDSSIRPLDPKAVVSEKAYVLFYKRTKA
ncbi:hypothetical protein D9615_007376 [Tricholomella constricta]|uniref:ubiquitinyl hydrolase 1 n=1 Tax=Tricholomella constricta TaxID=117010 RepID=A0A8H5GYG1_9AGAR|nr:hypothetical protein D9615_007376 [Tricholomella constricta]